MNHEITDNTDKKLKVQLYGKPQRIRAIFSAGMGSIALDETTAILNSLWFPQKYTSELALSKNEIRIDNIHLFAATELLMRSQCLSDIRLIILEKKVTWKSVFKKKCEEVNWKYYLNSKMTIKIKVDSVASKAFHEAGLKEILGEILKEYVAEIVSGEDSNETTCVYADLYKDKLTISISLAGDPLYKRGYRGTLSASAPLREDTAACCIRNALQFAKKFNADYSPNTVMIPFSGTGTFAFEYLISYFNFSPVIFDRHYAIQFMPLFRPENFNYLLKKSKEHTVLDKKIKIDCIDNSDNANHSMLENKEFFRNAVVKNGFIFDPEILSSHCDNFLAMDFKDIKQDVFVPLNPPYGIRLNSNADTVALYQNIARKLNDLSSSIKPSGNHLAGFILCPSEESWSAFLRNLKYIEMSTYHFNQGGLDVRVCQFYN